MIEKENIQWLDSGPGIERGFTWIFCGHSLPSVWGWRQSQQKGWPWVAPAFCLLANWVVERKSMCRKQPFRRPSVVSNDFATYVQRLFVTLRRNSLQPHGLYSPQNSSGQNTGVGSLSLLQGIFPTQGLNPGLPHCRRILYQLSHQGSPFRRPRDLTTGRVMKLTDCTSPPI